MGLTREQYEYLIKPIAPSRVQLKQGQSHVQAWDIRRTLTRIFGFTGWDEETIEETLESSVGAEKGGRIGWTVVFRVRKRLTIKDAEGNTLVVREGSACGDAINLPSIGDAFDFSLKTADSQALKRCCIGLGDQFGLSLYNRGSVDAVIGRTLVVPGDVIEAQALAEVAAADAPVEAEDEPVVMPGPTGPVASRISDQEPETTEIIIPEGGLNPGNVIQYDAGGVDPQGFPPPTLTESNQQWVDDMAGVVQNSGTLREAGVAYYEALKTGLIGYVPRGQQARPPLRLYEMWMGRMIHEIMTAPTIEAVDQVMIIAAGTKVEQEKTPVGKTLTQLALDRKNRIVMGGDNKPPSEQKMTIEETIAALEATRIHEPEANE